jgi:hypothetical protein
MRALPGACFVTRHSAERRARPGTDLSHRSRDRTRQTTRPLAAVDLPWTGRRQPTSVTLGPHRPIAGPGRRTGRRGAVACGALEPGSGTLQILDLGRSFKIESRGTVQDLGDDHAGGQTGAVTTAAEVNEVRRRLRIDGPRWMRDFEHDFEVVTLPECDSDILRDLLIREGVSTIVEVGLAYGSSALAIGEALLTVGGPSPRHVIIDAFQSSAFSDVGWDVLGDAGLHGIATLTQAPSSIVLAELVGSGFVAEAAFVDGSHRFHEVFVDLYFLRKIVRPGGLVVMDDTWTPSVRTAVRYYERNLGWSLIAAAFADGTPRRIADDPAARQVPRCSAFRLPDEGLEPPFESFRPFG